jgi:hypothetical protein
MDVIAALKSQTFVVLIALVGPLLLSTSAKAQSVYEALFGRLPVQQRSSGFYFPAPAPGPFSTIEIEPRRRTPGRRPERLTDINATPTPVMPQHAKPARAASSKEIISNVLADSTLQKGDIVVFPDGPRVYRGGGGSAHRSSDFEDLRASRLVSESTRKTVLASTQTSTFTQVAATQPTRSRTSPRQIPADVTSTGSVSVSAAR